jgi:hypothetical protein
MDMRKFNGGGFLKIEDVRAQPLTLRIVDIAEGQYGRPDVEFDDGTKLSLNVTNNRTLTREFGFESTAWLGKQVELSLGETMFEGKSQESIIVKPIASSPLTENAPLPQPMKKRNGDMDDDIPF